jgi:hypothetical protein
MAKRMTDSEKWKDQWFSNLNNDYKIVWFYLLDDCDNAGIWQCNIRTLNFNCNTSFTEADLLNTFSKRLTKISDDKFLINKFCEYQYGIDFITSKNKAVISAINKLKSNNLIEDNKGIYTLTIPYQYPIDTPKEQEQDKFKDKFKDKDKEQEQVKDKLQEFIKFKRQINKMTTTEEFDNKFSDILLK